MQYISVKEAAQRWGISERRVRALCEAGRIEGVTHVGDWVWSIPAETQRPADGRTLRYMKNRNLRTGSQDYSAIDAMKKTTRSVSLSESQKAQIIAQAYAYDEVSISQKQISSAFALNPTDVPFEVALSILNMRGALRDIPVDISEKTLCEINKRIMLNIDESAGGNYAKDSKIKDEIEALFSQYSGDWSILHPVARASFLFTELLRIQPFENANTETAFVVLENEMLKAKLPPVIFDLETTAELRAALASAQLRGNTQQLVSMIIEALKK